MCHCGAGAIPRRENQRNVPALEDYESPGNSAIPGAAPKNPPVAPSMYRRLPVEIVDMEGLAGVPEAVQSLSTLPPRVLIIEYERGDVKSATVVWGRERRRGQHVVSRHGLME